MNDINSTLPFDQYQRYRLIADALQHLRVNEKPLNILDVGGWPGTLRDFLPADHVTIADIQDAPPPFVKASGTKLPFPDASFNVVVSSDTLEHVPNESRVAFLSEMCRVSRDLVLLSAPFDSPAVRHAEEVLQSIITDRYGEPYDFIEEHRRYGLPDLQRTIGQMQSAGLQISVLPNGYLPRWLLALSTFFLLQWRFKDKELNNRANAFYNTTFYADDICSPSYRYLIIASHSRDVSGIPDALTAHAQKVSSTKVSLEATVLPAIVTAITEKWSEQALALEKQLADRDAQIATAEANNIELQKELHAEQVVRDATARQLQEVLHSRTWRIGDKLWSIARRLLPNCALDLMRQLIPPSTLLPTLDPVSSRLLPPAVSKVDEATADVFAFPVIDWHFRTQRPQHLAMAMANAGHRVFYFSVTFGLPSAGLPFRVIEVIHDRILLVELVCPKPQPNVYSSVSNAKQQHHIVQALNEIRRHYNVAGLVSLVDHPFWTPMATALQGNIIIYDCMDYHAGFADSNKHIHDMEAQLLRQADLVLTSSAPLRDLIQKAGRDSVLIRNAAEVEFFSKRPKRLAIKRDRPIIGYYGAIAEWFDIKLLTEVAKDNPQWAFELVGSTRGCDITQASRLPNVTFHDEVSYAVLPEYLYTFDVCLIPFKRVPLTECTNPVKIYEYLAAGKPVVATPLPELQGIGDIIHLASTPAEFAEKISAALADAQNEDSAKRRRDWAQQHIWKHRVADLQVASDCIQKKASVIILTYNNLEFTKACLCSLALFTDYPDWELIIVDNASSDATPAYLTAYAQEHSNVKVILNSTNVGFPAGNNIGIKAATGEYVVLLNNDTYVTRGWLTDLLRPLRLDPQLGLVGPVTNNIGNEAKINICYKNMQEMADAALCYTSTHSRQLYPVEKVAFFCAAMRRDVLDKAGLLDEAFGRGFFEDDDYCNRVRQAGYRITIAEDVFIHHHLAASFSSLPDNGREALFNRNRVIYEMKWGPWHPHQYR